MEKLTCIIVDDIEIDRLMVSSYINRFSNFEILEKDQLIGVDGEEEITSEKKCVILFAHNGKNINDEVFLLGEI